MEIYTESRQKLSWLGHPGRHRTLSQPTELTKQLIFIIYYIYIIILESKIGTKLNLMFTSAITVIKELNVSQIWRCRSRKLWKSWNSGYARHVVYNLNSFLFKSDQNPYYSSHSYICTTLWVRNKEIIIIILYGS